MADTADLTVDAGATADSVPAGATAGATAEPAPTLREVLDGVRRLTPAIAARAGEIEAARRLPPDLIADLTSAGCFRVMLPTSHGGVDTDLAGAMQVFEALSRADGSVGWTVMIGATSWVNVAGLPRASFDSLFADGPDAITASVFNPTGTAEPVDGGYRVTGRWAFASGCEHARWIFPNCIETGRDGAGGDGPPPMRMVVLPPEDVEIEDTWRVSGLRGTGSHHVSVHGVIVPPELTAVPFVDEPCVDTPTVRIPPAALYALIAVSVAVGIAGAAYDDVLALAGGKVPLLAQTPLATNPFFQHQVGTMDAELRAARTLLDAEAAGVWAVAAEGGDFDRDHRARIRTTTTWAAATAASVVDTAYTAAGGGAINDDNPLQRRFRDVHALTQHFLVRPDTLTTAGAVLTGQDVDLTIF